jgi:transposase
VSSKTKKLELPTDIESCHNLIRTLLAIIELNQRQHKEQLEQMASKIASLEARLNQNSQNSSSPPSSDKYKTRPGIPKVSKNQGGQKGHKGRTLCQVDNPDKIVVLRTDSCTCGQKLDPEGGKLVKKYQVFDLPQPKLEVTEYQVLEQICTCGCVVRGQLPPEVRSTVQYGAGVRALTVMLNNSCQMSVEKIRTLFNDLYGYDLNESTSISNNKLAFLNLQMAENQTKERLEKSELVHSDETGLNVSEGKGRYWLHTICNSKFTYLFVSPKRGIQAHTPSVSFLDRFKGWILHDCYAFYFKFTQSRHALCCPHLLRELTAQIEEGKTWASTLHKLLLGLYQKTEKGLKIVADIDAEKKIWQEACTKAIQLEELLLPQVDLTIKKRGKKKRGKSLALLDRLLKYSNAILAFAEFEIVPFSNNQAERDLRPAKTKQKVAGCFRTPDGAHTYARIQGFISTCRKQQLHVFNELRTVCSAPNSYVAPWGAK